MSSHASKSDHVDLGNLYEGPIDGCIPSTDPDDRIPGSVRLKKVHAYVLTKDERANANAARQRNKKAALERRGIKQFNVNAPNDDRVRSAVREVCKALIDGKITVEKVERLVASGSSGTDRETKRVSFKDWFLNLWGRLLKASPFTARDCARSER